MGAQHPAVPVQELHGSKVSVAHPDDDDGHGQLGSLHHGVARLVHVTDDPVRDDEEDEVLLQRGEQRVRAQRGCRQPASGERIDARGLGALAAGVAPF